MDCSVVVPCFNSERTIAAQLDALLEADWPESWELLIVDNDSTDSTLEIVARYHQKFPNLRIIKASDKKGSGYARNVGVNHAKANKILFCDADDRVSKSWLKVMSFALNTHEFIAGRITLESINEAWRIPKKSILGNKDKAQEDIAKSRFNPSVRIASSCNMGVSKIAHFKISGFDESIPFAVDYDYCWRMSKVGYQPTFIQDGLVEYRLRHSLKETFIQNYNWGKAGILIYRKHIGKGKLIDRARFILGGWRYLPLLLLKLRRKSDIFDLAAWLAVRVGEMDGCWQFLIMDRMN